MYKGSIWEMEDNMPDHSGKTISVDFNVDTEAFEASLNALLEDTWLAPQLIINVTVDNLEAAKSWKRDHGIMRRGMQAVSVDACMLRVKFLYIDTARITLSLREEDLGPDLTCNYCGGHHYYNECGMERE